MYEVLILSEPNGLTSYLKKPKTSDVIEMVGVPI